MSLFGQPQSGGASPFGSANKPNPFGSSQQSGGGLFGSAPQNQQSSTGGGGLFGNAQNQQQQSTGGGGLFGNTQNQQQPSTGGGLFGNTQNQQQPSTGGGLFGNTQSQQPSIGGGLFGSTQNQQQPSTGGGLFGQPAQPQQQQGGGLFGSNTQNQQQTGGGLFGSTQQKPQGGLFGGSLGQQNQQQPQQTGGLFGSSLSQQKPQGSLFGGVGQQQQPQQQGGGLFGSVGSGQQQQQPQQQGLFGGSLLGQQQQPQPQAQQQPQLGQTMNQQQNLGSSLWSPGRAITGVHRPVPTQIQIMQGKWDAYSRSSAFRTYIYNNAGQENAPFFSPGVDDDEAKWEEAFRKRPDPGFVPILTRGFFELGKRAQVEKDHATRLQWRLHQVDDCLNSLLSCHDLKISVRIADARRKHIVLSKRCLALAAKTQVLRNRGYAMDEAEEELKSKLAQLERAVFDPSLNGRSEEIWARMVAIRDRSTRLKQQIANAGPGVSGETNGELDEETMKTARKILDNYHAQIQHLQKELAAVRKDFDEAQKFSGLGDH